MTQGLDRYVTAAHKGKDPATLADLPIDALHGVSAADREAIRQAIGIETIRDLATDRFVSAAASITHEAGPLEFDRGPGADWVALFAATPHDTYHAHPDDFRLEFGPAYYRGRLDGSARVLVIGQDPAPNELIAQRAFIGNAGQRLQALLRRIGLGRDYIILNTFIYPIHGQFFQVDHLSEVGPILEHRNQLLDHAAATNRLEAIIAAGAGAQHAVEHWTNKPDDVPVVEISHPSDRDTGRLVASWNAGLAELRGHVTPEGGVLADGSDFSNPLAADDEEPIPRGDVPFGLPAWHGDGNRARRGRTDDNQSDPKVIIWEAP